MTTSPHHPSSLTAFTAQAAIWAKQCLAFRSTKTWSPTRQCPSGVSEFTINLGPLKDVYFLVSSNFWANLLRHRFGVGFCIFCVIFCIFWVVFLGFWRHVSGLFWAASCFWSRPKKSIEWGSRNLNKWLLTCQRGVMSQTLRSMEHHGASRSDRHGALPFPCVDLMNSVSTFGLRISAQSKRSRATTLLQFS